MLMTAALLSLESGGAWWTGLVIPVCAKLDLLLLIVVMTHCWLAIIFIQLMKVIYKFPLTQILYLIRFKLHSPVRREEAGSSDCSQKHQKLRVSIIASTPVSGRWCLSPRSWPVLYVVARLGDSRPHCWLWSQWHTE